MSKIVKHVKLHQGLFVPGLGDLGASLPALNKTLYDFGMSTSEHGVIGAARKTDKGPMVTWLMPYANIVSAVLGEDIAQESKSPKKAG